MNRPRSTDDEHVMAAYSPKTGVRFNGILWARLRTKHRYQGTSMALGLGLVTSNTYLSRAIEWPLDSGLPL